MWSFDFFLMGALLGVGLAMDAFSISLANGLNEPQMKKPRMLFIAGTFAFCQFIMPMIGWFCVHEAAKAFESFSRFIPWIALVLLAFIGGNMLKEGITNPCGECGEGAAFSAATVLVQGVATSIDALSVGFTIAEYNALQAFVCAVIIAVETLFICLLGIAFGKRFGACLAGKASILGGVLLILIGLEIFITGI